MKKLNLLVIAISVLFSMPAGAQNLEPRGDVRALNALDPPLSSMLEENEADRASHLGDGLQDILHQHLANRGAIFDLDDHVMANGARFGDIYSVSKNKVVVDFTVTGRLHPCWSNFEKLDGIEVLATASTTSYHVISALVPVDRLLDSMMVPGVAAAYGAVSSTGSAGYPGKSQGNADNMAEEALDVDDLRRVFSWIDGGGIEVGTLSDSVDLVSGGISDSQATGDLPANAHLSIIADSTEPDRTDEGRAMMEHIYDIAPALDVLGFATADGGQATFAAHITALADDGMDIINDDVVYYGEPYFQDGVIAQAVSSYVDGGGIYFSLNHNFSNLSYENVFTDDDSDGIHNFGAVDELATWTLRAGTAANPSESILGLQWTQPWGAATTDLAIDVYTLENPPVLVGSSNTNNIGGNPYDSITITNPGAEMQVGIAIRVVSGSVDDLTFKYINFNNGGSPDSLPEYQAFAAGTLTPHAGISEAIAIGAAPYFDRNVAEDFSGHGPHKRFFTDAGVPMGPYTFTKPDFLSVDRCNTTFFGGDISEDADAYPNFSGTSAATPNAAAVAALILEAAGGPGTLSANGIRNIMAAAAIDVGPAGHDTVNGYGRINALGAGVAAYGPLNVETSIYLNQYGDASVADNLGADSDIDTFEFSTNYSGGTTISLLESHAEMDPMMVLFQQLFDTLIDIDYNSGTGDDAYFSVGSPVRNYPYSVEVLSESEFAGSASFTLVVDAPDQELIDRTAYLDANGFDDGYSGSLTTLGQTNYITYVCPSTGSLFIGLHPDGFLGYIRLYDAAGDLVAHGLVSDGYSGGLSVDSVTAGETYAIQIVSWGYTSVGSYELTADFGSNQLFSDGFESGSTSRWSSVVGN